MFSQSLRFFISHLSILDSTSRLASTSIKVPIPSPKLTQSYYHHASEIPLLYHTVGQHLDYLAAEHPNHECLLFKAEGNKYYTYKTLRDEVDSLAAALIELGFEKNDRLGVWLPNTSQNCVVTYAASKVGVIKVTKDIWNTMIDCYFTIGEYQSSLYGSRTRILYQ